MAPFWSDQNPGSRFRKITTPQAKEKKGKTSGGNFQEGTTNESVERQGFDSAHRSSNAGRGADLDTDTTTGAGRTAFKNGTPAAGTDTGMMGSYVEITQLKVTPTPP